MATYKVIQDIEAEDKLLGPLSLRQFGYAAIVIVLGFIAFKLATVMPLLAIPFLPPMILFGILAAPFGHDQSSEIWLLAKIQFHLKPRIRVWDQSGLQELVTITVPKKIEKHLTNGLDQTQVRSRLEALAQTIDTRGWATKGVNVNLFTDPSFNGQQSTDRLVDATSMTSMPVADFTVSAQDDILDEQNNPLAHKVDEMVRASGQAHRAQIIQQMQTAAQQPTQTQQQAAPTMPIPEPPQSYATFSAQTITPATPATSDTTSNAKDGSPLSLDEQLLNTELKHRTKKQEAAYGHTRVLNPQSDKDNNTVSQTSNEPMTPTPNPDILNLAHNDDLSVATIARQANKKQTDSDDEVVISLR